MKWGFIDNLCQSRLTRIEQELNDLHWMLQERLRQERGVHVEIEVALHDARMMISKTITEELDKVERLIRSNGPS